MSLALVGVMCLLAWVLAGVAGAASETLVARGSVWRYLDNGSDQGVAWRAPGFVDSGWKSGPAELGYGDGDERTVVGYGPDANHKYRTTYFRSTFPVSDPGSVTTLALGLRRDDGAAVYLNGVEVVRSNLPTGSLTYLTDALTWDVSETAYTPFSVSPSLLVAGVNTLAVEIHQNGWASSDISMDLDLVATRSTTTTTSSTTTTTAPTTTTTTTSSTTTTTAPTTTTTTTAPGEAATSLFAAGVPATPPLVATGDTASNELGVKFRSDVAGRVTGLRFWKPATNTGTHVGHLWTASGTLLATATFTGESASGWQSVSFASPVAISANTVYVASYLAPNGNYAYARSYFSVDRANGTMHGIAEGQSGHNGAYKLGAAGGFPTLGYQSSNYWVDVTFVPSGSQPTTTTSTTAPTTTAPTTTTTTTVPPGGWSCAAGYVALTFDDGPDIDSARDNTPKILDTLKAYGVHATFFVLGEHVADPNQPGRPDLVAREAAEGQTVGSHSYQHYHLPSLSNAEITYQLSHNIEVIAAAGGGTPRLFRPPYGDTNNTIYDISESLGMRQVLWDISPGDTGATSAQWVVDRVMPEVRSGSIVTLHDGSGPYTAAATPLLLDALRQSGFCPGLIQPSATFNDLVGSYVAVVADPNGPHR